VFNSASEYEVIASLVIAGAAMPKSSTPKPVEDLSYEEALAELEKIVTGLEAEQHPLDEAVQLFERGQALAARCTALLESAELKVRQLAGDSVIPFEEESS